MSGFRDIEREMIESIDIEALEREFGITPRPPAPEPKPQENKPRLKTKAESTICKKTGKVQFDTAQEAIDALKAWKMRDRKICWDLPRLRVYKCKKCHKMHLGKIS